MSDILYDKRAELILELAKIEAEIASQHHAVKNGNMTLEAVVDLNQECLIEDYQDAVKNFI